jgi:GAF domain-containing protein
VHGIDLSEAMVARLRAKPGAERIGVTIGDFATTRVEGRFTLAYLVFNTIMNLTTQEAQVACFRDVAARLEPGGCFVIEVRVPELRGSRPGRASCPGRWPQTIGCSTSTELDLMAQLAGLRLRDRWGRMDERAVLVANELVTNAVVHGRTDRKVVWCTLSWTAHELRLAAMARFLAAYRGQELGMGGQLDGRAVARALRGLTDVAPVPGDLPTVLQQLVDTAKTVLATDGVGLMLGDENGHLRSTVTTDAVAELLEQVQADFGEGPCLTAYGAGEPVAVTDLGADPRWVRLAAVVGQVSVRAVAAVPVRFAGVVVGTLNAYTTTTRTWSPEELGGLEAFAELAAGVVQGGARLDASETEVGQLRQALTSRVLIEQAKGVLVAREGVDPEAAFQRLRRQARSTARPIAEVAGEVIAQARAGNATARARAAAAGSARRLAELEQVAAGFAAARTSTTVARLVVDRGLRALDAQAGLIGLNSADGQALELVAWAGYPVQAVTPWRRIPLEAPTPLTEVARNGGAIWVSNPEEFQARYPDVPVVVEHQAHAAIGLVVEGRPAGALGISFIQPRTFSEVDRRFIQALASHCSQALERVGLAEQARAARTKLAAAQARALTAERAALAAQANAVRAREQAGYLAEASAMLAGATDLQAVLEQMAWLAVPRLGDWCQLHLRQPDGATHHHTVAHSDPADAATLASLTNRGPIDLTGAAPATAKQADQPLLMDHLEPAILHQIAKDAAHLELLTALRIGSAMVVPLAGRTRILGTITLASHQPGRYGEADLTLVQNLARRTAAAIEHADRAHHPDPPTPGPEPRPTAD